MPYQEIWHWYVRVLSVDRGRYVIEETGDTFNAVSAWSRVGEALRRRGDDIAQLFMADIQDIVTDIHQGFENGRPHVEVQCSVMQLRR